MDSLDKLLARLFTLHRNTIELSLDRIHRILVALGSPEMHCPPVIHVAGTNGKGSTIAFMRAILETRSCIYLATSRAVPRAHPAWEEGRRPPCG